MHCKIRHFASLEIQRKVELFNGIDPKRSLASNAMRGTYYSLDIAFTTLRSRPARACPIACSSSILPMPRPRLRVAREAGRVVGKDLPQRAALLMRIRGKVGFLGEQQAEQVGQLVDVLAARDVRFGAHT